MSRAFIFQSQTEINKKFFIEKLLKKLTLVMPLKMFVIPVNLFEWFKYATSPSYSYKYFNTIWYRYVF